MTKPDYEDEHEDEDELCPYLVAQMPASQIDEHILQRGVMSRKSGQGASGLLEMREQQRQRFVQVLDRQRKTIRMRFDGMNPGQSAESGFVERAIALYLHHIRAAQGLNQFSRCAKGDDFPFLN